MHILESITNFFHRPTEAQTAPVPTQDVILSKIGQIGAQEIADWSSALVQLVLVNLGNNARERYTRQSDDFNQEINIHTVLGWDQDYLACNDHSNFMSTLQTQFEQIIRDALSTPLAFMENGLTIVLSEENPIGPLLTALETAKMHRFENDMPRNYVVHLRLSPHQPDFVNHLSFELTQRINQFEFYSVSFKV